MITTIDPAEALRSYFAEQGWTIHMDDRPGLRPDPFAAIVARVLPDAETLARWFHETYERLALIYHYGTRPESAVPWEDVPTLNKALMIATAKELLQRLGGEVA